MKKRNLVQCLLLPSFIAVSSMNISYAEEQVEVESIEATINEETRKDFDFKKFYWGDNKEHIIEVEGEPYTTGEMSSINADYIAYKTSVAGKDALLAYYFCGDGLFQTRYILSEDHSNESLYIDDYKDVRDALKKKYGDPLLDNESWSNDSKKSYYSDDKGKALCYGYLKYFTFFSTETTYVSMNMSADNYDISTTIQFESKTISAGDADYSKDFKIYEWGSNEETVIEDFGKPQYEGDMTSVKAHYLAYDTRIVGLDALVAYYFCDDGLFEIRYIMDEDHSNEAIYIDDYIDIRKALTDIYGEPLFDNENWSNDSKKSYYSDDKGKALCYGYLTYYTLYSLDDTYINMNMDADNYDISTTIQFESKTISAGEPDYSDDF